MSFKLPSLPYSYSSLEPHIDKETMKIHHGKHHAAYVNNLNKTLKDHPMLNKLNIEDLLKTRILNRRLIQPVINNGGGHANHSLFWRTMTPKKSKLTGKLLEKIEAKAGDFETFKKHFGQKALTLFGSGWVFLIVDKAGNLSIKRHSFQNSPLMHGNTPLLGLDVWEHAYYLKYQNRRAEYIKSWWNVVNWEEVSKIYQQIA